MLDLALSTIEAPFPPEIPRIVEERQWLSDLGSRAARRTTIAADEYQAVANQWVGRLRGLQDRWAAAAVHPASDADLEAVGTIIQRTEDLAAHRAAWRRSFAKRSERAVKRTFSADPSLAAVHRAFVGRLLAIDDEIVEVLLDHALFLRAIRADADPAARGGRTFSDGDEMERHVRAMLGT